MAAVRRLAFVLACVLLVSLQAEIAPRSFLAPEFFPALALHAGWFARRGRWVFGAVAAALVRAAAGPEPAGLYVLSALAIAAAAARARAFLFVERPLAQWLGAFLAGALHLALLGLFGLVAGDSAHSAPLWRAALAVTIATAVAPAVLQPLRWLGMTP